MEKEADQQVCVESHALPADEHQQIVVRQYQGEHEEHEKVHVCEEAIEAAFMRHVADRVNVNQEPDSGDHQDHHGGELVKIKAKWRREISGGNPGADGLLIRHMPGHMGDGPERPAKGDGGEEERNKRNNCILEMPSEKAIDGSSSERQQGNDPEI